MATPVVFLLLAASSPLLACECVAPENYERWVLEEFDRAAVVFAGTARATQDFGLEPIDSEVKRTMSRDEMIQWTSSTEIEFTVYGLWKGDSYGVIRVRTESPPSACLLDVEVGAQLVVVAYAIENDDSLYMRVCSPTSRRDLDPASAYQVIVNLLRQRAERR